jgi:magnesium transporter
MAENLLFFTELVGLKVYDTRGRKIGGGWAWLTIRYDQVKALSLDGIFLKDEKLTPYHSDEYMLRIHRDLLDQQIIDALGRKVVRVNDVTFDIRTEPGYQYLSVLEVDIGVRSIVRRVFQGVLPRGMVRRLQQPISPNSISWEYCNIVEPDPQRRLRLNISNQMLEKMHPADLADIVEELSPEDREAIIENLDAEVAAEALSEMDPDVQASILESLEREKAAEIIEEMSPDEAAHALAELEEETSSDILDEVTEETKTEVSELIDYDEHTAGFLMNTEYVAVPVTATVQEGIDALRSDEELLETLNTIFLIDGDGRLKGAVPLAKLFIAPGTAPLQGLALDSLIQVPVDEAENRVTEIFDKYNVLTLPVIDEERRLAGVITADDVISVLRAR